MPLIQSDSKEAIAENIRMEIDSGKDSDQAKAIAMAIAEKVRKDKKKK